MSTSYLKKVTDIVNFLVEHTTPGTKDKQIKELSDLKIKSKPRTSIGSEAKLVSMLMSETGVMLVIDEDKKRQQIIQLMNASFSASSGGGEDGEEPELTEEQFWEDYVCDYLYFESFDNVRLKKPAEFDYLSSSMVGKNLDMMSLKLFITKLYATLDKSYSLPYKEKVMIADIERSLPYYAERKRTKLFDSLRHTGNTSTENLEFLLNSMKVENPGEDIKILRHMIWSVKRRAYGMDVFNEVFPTFVGKPGTAKSTLCIRLGSPLEDFFKTMELSDLSEERDNALTSNRSNLMLFDEMTGADKQDINKLKRWVTAKSQGVRIMQTNGRSFFEKMAFGIGTSNLPLRNILRDSTGNRRFYEIKVGLPKNVAPDWVDTAKFPEYDEGADFWKDIWLNVDETKERGYWDPRVDEKIISIMDSCVLPSAVSLWADKYRDAITDIKNDDNCGEPESYLVFESLDNLWESFSQYEKDANYQYKINRDRFKRECEEIFSDIHPGMVSTVENRQGLSVGGFMVIDKLRAKAKKSASVGSMPKRDHGITSKAKPKMNKGNLGSKSTGGNNELKR